MKSITAFLIMALVATSYSFLLTTVTSANGQKTVTNKKKGIVRHARNNQNTKQKSCRYKAKKHT